MDAPEPHRALLDRATAAIERMDARLERHERAFERHGVTIEKLLRRWDEHDALFAAREERLMGRWERSEKLFVEAMSEISLELRMVGERLDDMGDQIKANTQAVLRALDRFGPGPETA